ncbi:MAG: AmmeMemoRadiSam system protein B [Planctomycetota bacterium]|nr:AmmeMemoRadiSam system protein B [Planctomycetota bacterium]MDA1141612.1 AmmeMemoRadiSam system protein B [Planctomycetota bacterium]
MRKRTDIPTRVCARWGARGGFHAVCLFLAVSLGTSTLTAEGPPSPPEGALPEYHPEMLKYYEAMNVYWKGRREPPSIRRVESKPYSARGVNGAVIEDPSRISRPLILAGGELAAAQMMNGKRSFDEIFAELSKKVPQQHALAFVNEAGRKLDGGLFLNNLRYRTHYLSLVKGFLKQEIREPVTRGDSYPMWEEETRALFNEWFPNRDAYPEPPSAIVSPHIDYNRGRQGYIAIYEQIRGLKRCKRFVILGTSHTSMARKFAATKKDFRTSLGIVETDRSFIGKLAKKYAHPLFEDEFLHRSEHSVELQLPFLQHFFGSHIKIVPILCGPLDSHMLLGTDPMEDPEVRDFMKALRETIDKSLGKTFVIAGSDLAHLGAEFGDKGLLEEATLAEAAKKDRALIDTMLTGDPKKFLNQLYADKNARRVCGAAPIYTLLHVAGPRTGKFIHYEQCTNREATNSVSIPGVAFYGGGQDSR